MAQTFRVISVSTVDGSLFDIAEFPTLTGASRWALSGQFSGSLHTFIVEVNGSDISLLRTIARSEWLS
jgi:hypothetical protein